MRKEECPHPRAAQVLAHVQSLIGTPFQAQGRLPSVGLDCVGVVCEAARIAGAILHIPADYSLSGPRGRDLETPLAFYGCTRRTADALAGDIVVMQGVQARQHLGVWTGAEIIHAHMALRCVVKAPVHPDWPIISSWCLPWEQ